MSRAPRPPASPATPRPSTARAASGCCAADAPPKTSSRGGDTRRPGTHRGGIPCPNPMAVPGGMPGKPITASQLGERLRALGIYAMPGRRAALTDLAAKMPAAYSPTCCASHQAPRSDGCTRQEATGPATPPNSPGNAVTRPDECLRRRSRASTTRHDRNSAGYPVATPRSRSSSSWPRPGTRTSAPPCATSNLAAKPSPGSPASSAHPAASTKSFPSLHPLHQCRSAAASLNYGQCYEDPHIGEDLPRGAALRSLCARPPRSQRGAGPARRRFCGAGGTTFPARARAAGITTSAPSEVRTAKEAGSFSSRMPRTSAICSPSPGLGRRQRITTRWPTSAGVRRTSSR
jgi:hypothetical protein